MPRVMMDVPTGTLVVTRRKTLFFDAPELSSFAVIRNVDIGECFMCICSPKEMGCMLIEIDLTDVGFLPWDAIER